MMNDFIELCKNGNIAAIHSLLQDEGFEVCIVKHFHDEPKIKR
jgi:hypothetical protein